MAPASLRRAFILNALPVALIALLLLAPLMRADELKLKDGTTIVGTIVGFEENSFKVKTSYGFAEVQKDQVVSIVISAAAKKKEPEKKPDSAVAAPPATTADSAKPPKAAPSKPSSPAANNSANNSVPPPNSAASAISNSPHPVSTGASPPARSAPAPNVAAANPPAPAPSTAAAPAPAPAKPAPPEPMREEVTGNNYVNETYGFRMYKPPAWKVIEGARALLPGSITAMGTDDQTTYLLIGQQSGTQSVAGNMETTERRLRDIMENFRPLDEKRITISGLPAVERHFRGGVDQRDWSGVVVYIPHGTRLYTIFGMTIASSDLVQIQENVIARAISSIQFTK